jgi:hypothetical protein
MHGPMNVKFVKFVHDYFCLMKTFLAIFLIFVPLKSHGCWLLLFKINPYIHLKREINSDRNSQYLFLRDTVCIE